ncbi:hypothetical protein [Frateuria defendens]|uniref:hypothetical protein n=1 Tax=Frateuria defendens TaxID=2219559 RepID=UPI00066FB691|nr:hypothetical protein [Frateuria defendens]
MRRAGRLCALLLIVPAMAGCSWLPWHRHRQPAPAAEAPAPAPAPAASAPAAASTAAPITPAPANEYAPYSQAEWRELYDAYQTLAQCEDRYMNSASLNSLGVGQRLVLLGKAGALRADALRLLDAASPLREQWTQPSAAQADRQAKLAADTLLSLMTAQLPESAENNASASLGRALSSKAVARYYVAQVTGGICQADQRYQNLMRKPVQ